MPQEWDAFLNAADIVVYHPFSPTTHCLLVHLLHPYSRISFLCLDVFLTDRMAEGLQCDLDCMPLSPIIPFNDLLLGFMCKTTDPTANVDWLLIAFKSNWWHYQSATPTLESSLTE